MDFMEGLPTSMGFETILVVEDCLSKGDHFILLKYPFTASSLAKFFVEHVIKLHGIPKSVMTNQGNIIMSSFWQKLFYLHNTK